MGSFVEGVYSVEIEHFSLLVAQGKGNEALSKAGRFDRMYYEKHGSFMQGNNVFEIRAYPTSAETVSIYLCLLFNADVVRFSSMVPYYDAHSNKWNVGQIVYDAEEFKPEPVGLGLPMAKIIVLYKQYFKEHGKGDRVLFKLVLGLYTGTSRKALPGAEAVPNVQVEPSIPQLTTFTKVGPNRK